MYRDSANLSGRHGEDLGSPSSTYIPPYFKSNHDIAHPYIKNFLDGNTAIGKESPSETGQTGMKTDTIAVSTVDSPENEENQNPIRSGVLIGARMTFKTVEAISGTIPGVGNYVGVAAKVGLAFVSMIEVNNSF